MGVSYSFHLDRPALSKESHRIGRHAMSVWQRRGATQAKVDVPVDTGNLGRTIGEGHIGTAGPYSTSGSIHAKADYALFVHEPTRPHLIRPKNPGGVLRFQVGGRTVFARLVHHPGTKGRPFLRNAAIRTAASL